MRRLPLYGLQHHFTIHAAHISREQDHSGRVFLELCKGTQPVARLDNLVPLGSQNPRQRSPQVCVIIGN